MSAPYIHNIYCSKLPSHLQYLILLDMIPMDLSAVKIEYGDPNSCMDYDIEHYGMKRSDCLSLSAALSAAFTLSELNLSSNLITDKKVEIICTGMAANPTIVSLDLSHNLISDVGCVALQKVLEAKNTVLMFLNLCNNKIHGIGTRALGFGIRLNTALLHLNLRHNDLADYGGHRIFDYMMDNQTIQKLSMSSCGLNEESVEALSKVLHLPQSALTSLDASANPGIGPAGGQIIYNGLVCNSFQCCLSSVRRFSLFMRSAGSGH
ncbi:hypothetical protein CY35_04G108900 [Sphagnum magellanicum]|nr:hypothetical protein CY35_04G108900 [Sphagnum magellanicum]